eukprot:TRINITY_DN8232_c0_g1_i1.p1 TRINITY_DN8232_c0_g1~~TRINITY_DN8232_c0_g1_i1.p1  ORF type:complete len:244 (+),score=8.56 TRINITY_DN8232_c0_g1_i1:266-997(+)
MTPQCPPRQCASRGRHPPPRLATCEPHKGPGVGGVGAPQNPAPSRAATGDATGAGRHGRGRGKTVVGVAHGRRVAGSVDMGRAAPSAAACCEGPPPSMGKWAVNGRASGRRGAVVGSRGAPTGGSVHAGVPAAVTASVRAGWGGRTNDRRCPGAGPHHDADHNHHDHNHRYYHPPGTDRHGHHRPRTCGPPPRADRARSGAARRRACPPTVSHRARNGREEGEEGGGVEREATNRRRRGPSAT